MNRAQELLTRVEIESGKLGVHLNAKKAKIMHYNQVNLALVLAKGNSTNKTDDNSISSRRNSRTSVSAGGLGWGPRAEP